MLMSIGTSEYIWSNLWAMWRRTSRAQGFVCKSEPNWHLTANNQSNFISMLIGYQSYRPWFLTLNKLMSMTTTFYPHSCFHPLSRVIFRNVPLLPQLRLLEAHVIKTFLRAKSRLITVVDEVPAAQSLTANVMLVLVTQPSMLETLAKWKIFQVTSSSCFGQLSAWLSFCLVLSPHCWN